MRIPKYNISCAKRVMQSVVGVALSIVMLINAVPAHGLTVSAPQHLGIDRGLSTTYVTDIAEDNKGFVWVASDNGLYRFDGYSFRYFSGSDLGLRGNAFSTLYHDKATDKLWVGAKSGISRIDCSTGKIEDAGLGEKEGIFNVTDITKAADGGIWIANHYKTLVHISPEGEETFYSNKDINGMPESFISIADDGRGHLVIAHNNEGITMMDIAAKKTKTYSHVPGKKNGIPLGIIHSVVVDSHKNIWLASNHGLSLFIPERETFHTFLHDPANPVSIAGNRVFSVNENSDGKVWVGCDMGRISIFDPTDLTAGSPENLSFHNINVSPDSGRGISNGNVRAIHEDSFGNTWICNYGTGLAFFSHMNSPFEMLPYFSTATEGFDNRVIWSAFTDTDGTTLLGGTNSIALWRDGKIEDVIGFTTDLSHPYSRVTTLGRGDGDLLVGLYDDGLLRLDRSSRRFERVDIGRPDIGINAIFNDPAGGTLIGCSEGILRYKDGKAEFLKGPRKILTSLSVTGLLRDSKNRLWVSTFGNGVFIFDGTFSKAVHIHPKQLKSGVVRSMYMDSKGCIWVLTNDSLNLFENTETGLRTIRLNHPDMGIGGNMRAIKEDNNGNMWFSTDTGLHVWIRKTGEFKDFSSDSALPNFNDRAVAVDNRGNMIFGGGMGACIFSPEFIHAKRNAGVVRIVESVNMDHAGSSLENDGVKFPDGALKIRYDSSVKIVFSVADFALSPLVEYAVMLDGIDSDWSMPMHDNYVVYRNLPPGKYNFKVRARLPDEDWNNTTMASMTLNVTPPLWGTWWAKVLYVVIVIAGVLLWVKYYKKRVNKRSEMEVERKKGIDEAELNEERLRFYTNITHELRTPLTLILGPLEDLVTDEETPQKFKEKIRIIHGSTLRLLNLINQILEFRKTETQNRRLCVCRRNLGEYITEIGLRYKELNRNGKVKYVIDVEKEGSEMYFDPDVISTIMNNLLSNAVKYTPEGTVTISLRHEVANGNKYVCISVADTGYGIEPDALPHIFDRYYQAKGKHQASGTGIGLALVKSLSELHGGILEVESTPGKGTVFTLKLIEDNTYPDALHSDSETGLVAAPEEPDDVPEEDYRPLVLVVEDNADIREYIAGALGKTFRIVEAENGQEGLDAALKNNPDIVVTDLMMPVMDGLELLSKLKGDIRTSHIPVVLLTARDSLQDKERGYDCGADSYLTKPFSAKLLNSRIHNLLAMRRNLASRFTSPVVSFGAPKINEVTPVAAESAGQEMKLSKFDKAFLEKFTTLVMDNLTNPDLDMPFMQDNLNMSHSTLYRKVKGLTGMSGKEFIRKLRLRHVVELLADGYSVSEAAYESGFNDMGYFRSCFKEEYGMSPSSYAKSLRSTDVNSENAPPFEFMTLIINNIYKLLNFRKLKNI